jgi:hypothetical protein
MGMALSQMSRDARLELAALYRGARAECRPMACMGGEGCWVEVGPEASRGTLCTKCRKTPRMRGDRWE